MKNNLLQARYKTFILENELRKIEGLRPLTYEEFYETKKS